MERMRMRDIEGKAAREAASECGQRASFNLLRPSFFSANGRIRRGEFLNSYFIPFSPSPTFRTGEHSGEASQFDKLFG
jgi:hypothetical protein